MFLCSTPRGRFPLWMGAGCILAWVMLVGHRPPVRTLTVISTPAGARISFEGSPLGSTPCQIQVPSRGRLQLQLDGYQTTREFLRLDEDHQELHLWLIPGANSQPGPGLLPYPPFRGTPPDCLWLRPHQSLKGQPFSFPRGWTGQVGAEQALELKAGDGLRTPLRTARLTVEPGTSSLKQRWQLLLEDFAKRGYFPVAGQIGEMSAWWRLERPEGLSRERCFLQLEARGPSQLFMQYRYPHCQDGFLYTRDLDYLRATLLARPQEPSGV